jgi:hypothetical protein
MIHRLFPASLLACISEGREPRKNEVEDLAAKIWREALRTDQSQEWKALTDQCQVRRRAITAAQVAFGRPSRDTLTLRHPESPMPEPEEEKPLFPWFVDQAEGMRTLTRTVS